MDSSRDSLAGILQRERGARIICSELNNYMDLKSTLMTVTRELKRTTTCEAVAVRLHHNGDYPYYVYEGFPESFIKKENSLCSRDQHGNPIPCPEGGEYLLDCMCGNIIRGRFDPSLPFFGKNGSFWSNNTSALLASTGEEERQGRTRNYCNMASTWVLA